MAWYQWRGEKQKKPDLRSKCHLSTGKKGVRIEFEIEEHCILLSDFMMWHEPLNYSYLSLTEEEDEAFCTELAQRELDLYGTGEHIPDPIYHARILKSWERIFDLDWHDETGWYGAETKATKSIQGTFWKLSLEQVRKVTVFTG